MKKAGADTRLKGRMKNYNRILSEEGLMSKWNVLHDLTGQTFGYWQVINRGPNAASNRTRWFCKCKCGKICLVRALNLKRGLTNNCAKCAVRKTHGKSRCDTYAVWVQMNERCHNENHKSYHNYGARGIQVCERWRKSFSNFLEDLGEAPAGMSIDRINNDQGYCKQNCKWETWKNQCRNKRNSIRDGDVYNDWKIISKIPNEHKYNVVCLNCNRERILSSCNVRQTKYCYCTNHKGKN